MFLFSNDDTLYELFYVLSLVVLGGLYMFSMVLVVDRHPPFISIINPSQCSYQFILHFTSVLYLLSTYILLSLLCCYNIYLVLYMVLPCMSLFWMPLRLFDRVNRRKLLYKLESRGVPTYTNYFKGRLKRYNKCISYESIHIL